MRITIKKRISSNNELVSFDDFLKKIIETCNENNGDVEDAIFIANDAYIKI